MWEVIGVSHRGEMRIYLCIKKTSPCCRVMLLRQRCHTHFHWRPHETRGCLERAECKFNSLTVKEYLHLYSPKIILALEGNHKADVDPSENEFDTPVLWG